MPLAIVTYFFNTLFKVSFLNCWIYDSYPTMLSLKVQKFIYFVYNIGTEFKLIKLYTYGIYHTALSAKYRNLSSSSIKLGILIIRNTIITVVKPATAKL